MYQSEYQDQESLDGSDFWSGYDDPSPSSPALHLPTLSIFSTEHIKVTTISKSAPIITVASISPISPSISSVSENRELYMETQETTESSEDDSYWAKYSSVHGTADSTIPSPREQHKTLGSATPEHIALHPDSEYELETRWTDPNPGLVDETEFENDVYGRGYDDAFAPPPSPQLARDNAEHDGSPEAVSLQIQLPEVSHYSLPSLEHITSSNSTTNVDEGVAETVRGVFKLWQTTNDRSKTMEDFLMIVRRAIESQK